MKFTFAIAITEAERHRIAARLGRTRSKYGASEEEAISFVRQAIDEALGRVGEHEGVSPWRRTAQ